MKKKIICFAFSLLLMGLSTSGAFAYRIWIDTYENGVLVSSKCGGSGGTCLPTIIIR